MPHLSIGFGVQRCQTYSGSTDFRKVLMHEVIGSSGNSPGINQRYDTLLLRKELQSMPDFRWCKNSKAGLCLRRAVSPTDLMVQCGSGQIHVGGSDRPIMRCQGCNARSCFRHDSPWVRSQFVLHPDPLLAKPNFSAL